MKHVDRKLLAHLLARGKRKERERGPNPRIPRCIRQVRKFSACWQVSTMILPQVHLRKPCYDLLPLNDKVQWSSCDVAGSEPPPSPRSEHFTGPFNR
ncbi:hypothetical protein RHMOL_Rhmol04G0181700 [Rhododendron molle]|uniref:Uncharacterized protein n=1 Tax=Rhododendron molle TaxID=49168 RepID=A0ACC0P219_RHOML|nr:hypothetical protein RHMOL_Rhmol04G0181700 [Rhododendron molle]